MDLDHTSHKPTCEELEAKVSLLFNQLECLDRQYEDLNSENANISVPSVLKKNRQLTPVDPVELLCFKLKDEADFHKEAICNEPFPLGGFDDKLTLEERILLRGVEYLQKSIAEKEKLVNHLAEILLERRKTKEIERVKTNKRLEAKKKMGAGVRKTSSASSSLRPIGDLGISRSPTNTKKS